MTKLLLPLCVSGLRAPAGPRSHLRPFCEVSLSSQAAAAGLSLQKLCLTELEELTGAL